MAKKKKEEKDEKQWITERIDADTNRLYGDIDNAIQYMQEMRDKYADKGYTHFGLEEHWTGYEDMEMVFSYCRLETDEEFQTRLEIKRREAEAQERLRLHNIQREKDMAELRRLENKLGISNRNRW